MATFHGGGVGLSPYSFELFSTKQNIPLITLNETNGARSSDRAYVPQICLSLFRHNAYDGVHETLQKCVDNNMRSFMIVIYISITYIYVSRIIQKGYT